MTPKQQQDLLDSFWYLLKEAESKAMAEDDVLLKLQVEGFFRQYSSLVDRDFSPRWLGV